MGRSAEGRFLAAALDLGSTTLKAALLDEREHLVRLRSRPSPPLMGRGEIREADPLAYAAVADDLLKQLAGEVPAGLPLGLACQRSSFLLWERSSGTPLTPLISWQDRRAAAWCTGQAPEAAQFTRHTGLPLSAHHAGPKLAMLLGSDSGLARRMAAGEILFGTLETFLLWRWSGGRHHLTDHGMAARTAMLDLESGGWSPELLARYGVPSEALPGLAASSGRAHPLPAGPVLTTTLADQAAAALAVCEPGKDVALINAGTGTFVLRPVVDTGIRRPGYLTAPLGGTAAGPRWPVLEGTINGPGSSLPRGTPTAWPREDPLPGLYCLPDVSGVGAPHWWPSRGPLFSAATRGLRSEEIGRVIVEGLLFRLREILDDLGTTPEAQVLLTGGLARHAALAPGLAVLLGRPVEILEEVEATLLGVARLAAGLQPHAARATTTIRPAGGAGGYLAAKYARWRAWWAELSCTGADGTPSSS